MTDAPDDTFRLLHETLGDEAANAMVDWMHRVDAQRADIRKLDSRFDRTEARLERLDTQVREGFARLEIAMERTRSDVIKWAFGFWLGTMVTVATLTRLLP